MTPEQEERLAWIAAMNDLFFPMTPLRHAICEQVDESIRREFFGEEGQP